MKLSTANPSRFCKSGTALRLRQVLLNPFTDSLAKNMAMITMASKANEIKKYPYLPTGRSQPDHSVQCPPLSHWDQIMADITLISGSTLGSSEYVADHLDEQLSEAGHNTTTLHGPELAELKLEGIWIIVTSTHGAGELPDNIQPLFDAIKEQQPDLSQLRYGAVGLGNREYDLFCGAVRQFDQLLTSLGAQRIGERLEIDVLEHEIPEDPAGEWLETWKTLI